MFAIVVLVVLLIAAVGAVYLILKHMGEDGVEAAAPGSCKSGNCGVRKDTGINTSYRITEEASDEADKNRGSLPGN